MGEPLRRRVQLRLSDEDIARLASAVDNALNIPAAMAVARRRGRAPALTHLKGRRAMRGALSNASVAKRRAIDVVVPVPGTGGRKTRQRPPRPGRPTGWPRTKADRERVHARTLELQAHPERRTAPTAAEVAHVHLGASGDAYAPGEDEMRPLCELTRKVASAAGIRPRDMPAPHAVVTMVTDGGCDWMRRGEARGATASVSVSIARDTASVEFHAQGRLITPPPLDRGQALLFDPSASHRLPVGDFRRVLSFDIPSGSGSGRGDGVRHA